MLKKLRSEWQRWHGSRCTYPWCLRHFTYDTRCGRHQFCDSQAEIMDLLVVCELLDSHRGWHRCGQHSWQNVDN